MGNDIDDFGKLLFISGEEEITADEIKKLTSSTTVRQLKAPSPEAYGSVMGFGLGKGSVHFAYCLIYLVIKGLEFPEPEKFTLYQLAGTPNTTSLKLRINNGYVYGLQTTSDDIFEMNSWGFRACELLDIRASLAKLEAQHNQFISRLQNLGMTVDLSEEAKRFSPGYGQSDLDKLQSKLRTFMKSSW